MSTDLYHNSNEFESINDKLRQHIQLANDEIEKVKGYVNELVVIVHNDNPTWSMKKISSYIAGRNNDLEELGFSANTIYKYLNEENRKLIDARKSHSGIGRKPKYLPSQELEEFREQKGRKILYENNTELSGFSQENQKVLENSSSGASPSLEAFRQEKGKLVGPSDDDVIDVSTFAIPREGREREEQQEVIYNNPKKIIKQYEVQLGELNSRYEELEAKYEQVITPFQVKQITIVKDQELPFIIKVDPYKRSVTSLELDLKEVKKLKEF